MKCGQSVLFFLATFFFSMNLVAAESPATLNLPATCPAKAKSNLSQRPIEAQAFRLMITGQFDHAIKMLTSHWSDEPKNYRLALLLAIAYEQTNQFEPAIETLMAILDHGTFRPLSPLFPREENELDLTFVDDQADKIFSAEVREIQKILFANMRCIAYRELFNYPAFISPTFSDSWEQSALEALCAPKPSDLCAEVIAHLGFIVRNQSEEYFKQIVKALESRNINNAEFKLRLTFNSFADPVFWSDALTHYHDDMDVQTVWIISPAFPGNTSQEQLRKLYDELSQKNPSLAILAAFGSLQGTAVDETILNDALNLLVKNNTIPHLVIYNAALKAIQAKYRKKSISPEIYLGLARELQKSTNTHSTQKSYFELLVFPELLAYGGDYVSLVKYLDQLFSHVPSSSISSQPTTIYYDSDVFTIFLSSVYSMEHTRMSIKKQSKIQDMDSWTRLLSDFNSSCFNVVNLLKHKQIDLKPLNVDELDRQAIKIKQPILRLLMADLCGKREKIQPLIQSIIDSPKATVTELLFAASWQLKNDNNAEVFPLLERARSLADLSTRKAVDGLILAYALNHVSAIKRKQTYVDKVQAITIDFYKQNPDTRDMYQLIMLFRTFGTNDDLPRILDLNKRLAKQQEIRQKQFQSSMPNDSSESLRKIDSLFRDNKKDQAIAELIKVYSDKMGQIHQKRWNDPMDDMGGYFFQEMANQLFAFSSVDQFIECLKVSLPDDPLRAGLEMGYACELLNKNEQAIASYRKMLKYRPNHTFANLHLALILIADKNTEKDALDYIARAAKENPYYAGSVLSDLICRQEQLKKIFPNVKLAIKLLENMDPIPPTGFDRYGSNAWFSKILIRMEKPQLENCISIPALLSVPLSESIRDCDSNVKPLIEKRYPLYLALCNAAKNIPMFSSIAISRKYALLKLNCQPLDELEAEARAAIISRARYDVKRTFRDRLRIWRISMNDFDTLDIGISPAVFYIGKLYREKRGEEISSFLRDVELEANTTQRAKLENIYRLYETSDDMFSETAQKILEENQQIQTTFFGNTSFVLQDSPSLILQVWLEGNKEVDLTPLALTLAQKMMKITMPIPADYSNFLHDWGYELFRWKGAQAFVEYLDQLRVLDVLSSDEEAAKLSFDRNLFTSLFNRWAHSDVLVLTLVDYLQSHLELCVEGRFDRINPLSYQLYNLTQRWDLLSQSGLFASIETFRPYYLNMPQKQTSLLQESLNYYHDMSEMSEKEFLDKVRKIEPATFGTKLWALLAEKKNVNEIYTYLGDNLDAIRKLSKNRQREIFESINAVLATYTIVSSPGDKVGIDAYNHSLTLLQESFQKKVRRFLSHKTEVLVDARDFSNYGAKLLVELIGTDKALADRVYDHTIKILKQQSQSTRNFYMDTNSPKGMLCYHLIAQVTDLPGLCYVTQKIQAADDNFDNYVLYGPLNKQWVTILTRWCEIKRKKEKYDELSRSERLKVYKKIILELDSILADPVVYPVSISGIEPQDYEFHFSTENLNEIVAWVDGTKNRKNPWLLDKISIDAQNLILTREGQYGRSPSPSILLEERIIQDESLSSGLRLAVYLNAFWLRESNPIGLPCAKTAIALIKQMGDDPFERAPNLIQTVCKYLAQMPIDQELKKEIMSFGDTWRRLAGTPDDYHARYNDINDPDVAMRMVQLYLAVGEKKIAREIFDNPIFGLKSHFPCVVFLLNYPVHDWIADIFSEHWKDLNFTIRYPTYYAVDAKKRDAANDVINRLADDDMKFFARTVYSQLPKYMSQEELIAFAKAFQTKNFSSPELQKKCLDILIMKEALSFLKEEKNVEFSTLTALAVATDESDNYDEKKKHFLSYLKELLVKGRLDEFHRQALTLKPALKDSFQEYSAREMMRDMCLVLGDYLITYPTNYFQINPSESDPIIPLANDPNDYLDIGTEIIMMNNVDESLVCLYGPLITLHFICDREKGLETWFANQSKLFKKVMTKQNSYPSHYSFQNAVLLFLRAAEGKSISQQSALAKRMISMASSPHARCFYKNITMSTLNNPLLTLNPVFKSEIDTLIKSISDNPEKALAEHPKDPLFLHAIIDHYQKNKQLEKAFAVCESWVEIDTGTSARCKMFYILLDLNRSKEALALCQELVKTAKSEYTYRDMLKKAYIAAGEYDKAVELVSQVKYLDSSQHFRFKEQADIMIIAKRYDEALAYIDKAREVSDRRSGKLDYAISAVKTCIKAGKFEEAQRRIETIEQNDIPSYSRNRIDRLKKTLDSSRKIQSTVGDLEHFDLQTLSDEVILKSLVEHYKTTKQFKLIEPVYRRWVEINPKKSIYYDFLEYLKNYRDKAQALELCEKMVKKFPNEKRVKLLLINSYLHCDKNNEALALVKTLYKKTDYRPNEQLIFIKEASEKLSVV